MGYNAGMSRSSALILLGVLVILAPFSGLPTSIRSLLAVIFGAAVMGIGFFLRTKEAERIMSAVSALAPTEPVAVVTELEVVAEPVVHEPPHSVSPI